MNLFVEIVGVVSGVLFVYLEIIQNRWMWMVGGVSALIYMYIFFAESLFAVALVQLYFLLASIYGWVLWSKDFSQNHSKDDKDLKIIIISNKMSIISIFISIIVFVLLWIALKYWSSDPFPALDSLIATISMLATYWVAKRFIYHWFLWIICNMLSIVLYLSQALYPTVLLYFIYLIAAIIGYIHWRKFREVLN